jgi:hypothetical protein
MSESWEIYKVLSCLPLESPELRNKIRIGIRTLHDFSVVLNVDRRQSKNYLQHWLDNHMYDAVEKQLSTTNFGAQAAEAEHYANGCNRYFRRERERENGGNFRKSGQIIRISRKI